MQHTKDKKILLNQHKQQRNRKSKKQNYLYFVSKNQRSRFYFIFFFMPFVCNRIDQLLFDIHVHFLHFFFSSFSHYCIVLLHIFFRPFFRTYILYNIHNYFPCVTLYYCIEFQTRQLNTSTYVCVCVCAFCSFTYFYLLENRNVH